MPAFDWLLNRLRLASKKAVTREQRRKRFMRPLRMERLSERVVLTLPGLPGPPGGDNDSIIDPWEGIIVLPPSDGGGIDPGAPVPGVSVSVQHEEIYETGNPRLSTTFLFSKPAGAGAMRITYDIGGTATIGSDYTLTGNTFRSIDMPANATSASFVVTAINDTVSDPDETVKVTLLPGPGYVIAGTGIATTKIIDDEPAPPTVSLSVDYTTITENDPFTTSTFTVTRNGTSGALTVGYFLSGTAIYNTDYSGPVLSSNPQGYVTIPNGQSTATFTVAPINDTIYDANETIIAGITSSASYTILGGPVTVTIIDDESPPGQPPGLPPTQPVTVAASRPTISEAEPSSPVTFTISRGGSTTNALVVNYKFTGSATLEDDYTAPGAATDSITIPAGASSVTFNVSAVDDNIDDDNEIVGVSILPGNDYQVSSTSSASVTIIDNDNPAMANVWVRVDKVSIAEATPNIPATFTFKRDGVLSQPLTVNYRVFGNATLGLDYTGPATNGGTIYGTITFATGQSTKTVLAYAIDDFVDDDHESFGLAILPGTNYRSTQTNGGRVYIEDNDGPYNNPPQYVSISVDREVIHEGSPNTPATFTISRNLPYGDLTVRYYLGGAAILNEDYYTSPGPGAPGDLGYRTITIPSDQLSVSFEAYPINDAMVEDAEGLSVWVMNGPGYIASGTGSAMYGYVAVTTIVDNDETVAGTVDVATIPEQLEGTSSTYPERIVQVNVSYSGSATAPFTARWRTKNDTAHADEDYVAASGEVSFSGSPGETKQIEVRVKQDFISELDEMFKIEFYSTSTPRVGTGPGSNLTIANDDTTLLTIYDGPVHPEAHQTFPFIFGKTGGIDHDIKIHWRLDLDEAEIEDFASGTPTTGVLTIPAGSQFFSQHLITFEVLDDSTPEPDEDFMLSIVSIEAGGRAVTADAAYSRGTIINDDKIKFGGLDFADISVTEGTSGGATPHLKDVSIPITVTKPVNATLTVDVATMAYTANASVNYSADFVHKSETLVFGPGVTQLSFVVQIYQDSAREANEKFFIVAENITISIPGYGSELIGGLPPRIDTPIGEVSGNGAVVTITNDDEGPYAKSSNPNSQIKVALYDGSDPGGHELAGGVAWQNVAFFYYGENVMYSVSSKDNAMQILRYIATTYGRIDELAIFDHGIIDNTPQRRAHAEIGTSVVDAWGLADGLPEVLNDGALIWSAQCNIGCDGRFSDIVADSAGPGVSYKAARRELPALDCEIWVPASTSPITFVHTDGKWQLFNGFKKGRSYP